MPIYAFLKGKQLVEQGIIRMF